MTYYLGPVNKQIHARSDTRAENKASRYLVDSPVRVRKNVKEYLCCGGYEQAQNDELQEEHTSHYKYVVILNFAPPPPPVCHVNCRRAIALANAKTCLFGNEVPLLVD